MVPGKEYRPQGLNTLLLDLCRRGHVLSALSVPIPIHYQKADVGACVVPFFVSLAHGFGLPLFLSGATYHEVSCAAN